MDAERPTSSPERGQRPQSQMDAERPTSSPERGKAPQSQMDAERPTTSPERGKAPQSQMEKEVPSKVSLKLLLLKHQLVVTEMMLIVMDGEMDTSKNGMLNQTNL